MKKTPIFTVNLRKTSAGLYLAIFCICVVFSSALSISQIKINLNAELIKSMVVSNYMFSSKTDLIEGVFPLFSYREKLTKPAASPPVEKETKQNSISKTLGENLSVKVSNLTQSAINTSALMQNPPDFLKEDIEVLILHTHASESYTPSEKYNFTPTDTYRTLDTSFNTVAVGKKIKEILEENGIKVHHDMTINDYPSYNESYNKSCAIAQKYIEDNPKIKIVLDVHRDAIVDANGNNVKYTSSIDGKDAASLMMVVGSNLGGLSHDNWHSNMSFALLLQEHINSMYPSLMRPVNFRKQRFNQHLAPGAIILEAGSNANTLDEALYGGECFARALSSYIKKEGV